MKENLKENNWWEEECVFDECLKTNWCITENMFPAISRKIRTNLTEVEAKDLCRILNGGCDAFTLYDYYKTEK
jgi:hypothetical protein